MTKDPYMFGCMTIEQAVDAFLYFGWVPRVDVEPALAPALTRAALDDCIDPDLLVLRGSETLRAAVANSLEGQNGPVVVPISGGLDSRAVLAAVAETTTAISTFTVGVPGSLDYELGLRVAGAVGVDHQSIDLRSWKYDLQATVDFAVSIGDWINVTDTTYNVFPLYQWNSPVVVSGLYGDFVAGEWASHAGADVTSAFRTSSSGIAKGLDPRLHNILTSHLSEVAINTFNTTENWYLFGYHTCTLRPSIWKRQFGYVYPFADAAWVGLMLSQPHLRLAKHLYERVLLASYPTAFALPVKNYSGAQIGSSYFTKHWRKNKNRFFSLRFYAMTPSRRSGHARPSQNYIDVAQQLRVNFSFFQFAAHALSSLASRDLPIKSLARSLLQDIRHRRGDRSRRWGHNVQVLLDLEVNLLAWEKMPSAFE